MKFPQAPPPESEFFEALTTNGAKLFSVQEPTHRDRYVHWDKLRYLTPPEGLSHREWWFGLKFHRLAARRPIALHDSRGRAFTYSVIDLLQEGLHRIDLSAGGHVQIPEPVLNPDTKDRYIVRSLIEEAITSSQLEGAATTREVAKEMIRAGRTPRNRSEQMIMNNYRTMQQIASVKNESLTKELVFELHRMVTTDTLDDHSGAGRFRRSNESIRVINQDDEVLHTPPPADQLGERMDLMCEFANGGKTDRFVHPAIRSMILHFWLAYDHPFIDGNGRTARALFYWLMLNKGYWLCEFLSISEIILKAPSKYGRALLYTETDSNDLTYFLVYHADILHRAIESLQAYVENRSSRLRSLEYELRGIAALNHRQRDLISHALHHPGHTYTIQMHGNSHKVVYQTGRTDLLDLAKRGLLEQRKRGKSWHFTPVLDLEVKLKSRGRRER
jgi:Fic family protein